MLLPKKISPYWVFQIGGWTLYLLVYLFFYITLSPKKVTFFIEGLVVEIFTFLLLTHLMRQVIRRNRLLDKPFNAQIAGFLLLTLAFSFLFAVINDSVVYALDVVPDNAKKYSFWNLLVRTTVGAFLFLFMWNSIYIIYHFISRSRRDLVERLRLENLVKQMELNTIKAHINPHFIFNALNSIRALVDEDPQRARSAITELSNILRSSMQAEKLQTTPLHKELAIVKDYLALEHIRFEQRLQVSYDVDDNTLHLPVPPMMLQTLVENAIKHGISKQVAGGYVHVRAELAGERLQLVVTNTGQLNSKTLQSADGGGFGLSSTFNRLKILYADRASFQIQNANDQEVEARLDLPVDNADLFQELKLETYHY